MSKKEKSKSANAGQDVASLEAEIVARISSSASRQTEAIRSIRREYSKRVTKLSPQTVVELALRLVERSQFLLRFVGYELIQHHKEAMRSLDAASLERLGKGIDDWAAVDTFASYLSGPAWRERQVPDRLIHGWARSDDRWWRRAAVVSTVPLNNRTRGGSGDAERTLKVLSDPG